MAGSPPLQYVDEARLQQLFNDGGFLQGLQEGRIDQLVQRQNHADPERTGQPFCTQSQIVSYLEGNQEVARVHQYLRPDGTIGASGRPDPKKVLVNGVMYCFRLPG